MIGHVYKIQNNKTLQIYIGSTIEPLNVRYSKHKYVSRSNTRNDKFHRIYKTPEDWTLTELIKIDHPDRCVLIDTIRYYETDIHNAYKIIYNDLLLNTYKPILTKKERKIYNNTYHVIYRKKVKLSMQTAKDILKIGNPF